jgi:hypothetical protein
MVAIHPGGLVHRAATLALSTLTLAVWSANDAAAAPSFVQQVPGRSAAAASLSVTPASGVIAGNRIVVEVGIWSNDGATASTVTDTAGNRYVELIHFAAPDKTEMSVWTAPITAGGGTRPTIKITPTRNADIGAAALEYSGLSTVTDATVLDRSAQAFGLTNSAGPVASGPTPATTAGNELALGFYVDSGFGDTLVADPAWTSRTNVSPTFDIEFVAEDRTVPTGATPNATVTTGPNTQWLMATLVLKAAVVSASADRISLRESASKRVVPVARQARAGISDRRLTSGGRKRHVTASPRRRASADTVVPIRLRWADAVWIHATVHYWCKLVAEALSGGQTSRKDRGVFAAWPILWRQL